MVFFSLIGLAAGAALVPASQAHEQNTIAVVETASQSAAASVPEGTPVRVMLTNEITSRTAKIGDKVKMRVDEPVVIAGRTLIPVGAIAWAEVSRIEKNGAAGKGGSLGIRLDHIQLNDGNVPLTGELTNKSHGNGTALGVAILGFGPLGLLMAGDSGRLNAGRTFTAFTGAPNSPAIPILTP